MVERAIVLLMESIRAPDRSTPIDVILEHSLVERASTAAPREPG
jgi:DNA-binding LacI/PurR family transcriptional regulator